MKSCKYCGRSFPTDSFRMTKQRVKGRVYTRRASECRECHNAQTRAWKQANREQYNASNRAANLACRVEAIREYGGRCVCCGETRYQFLGFDHINGGGTKHRKTLKGKKIERVLKHLGYPKDEFRLLCHNCNLSIGFYGNCPHQKEAADTLIQPPTSLGMGL